MLPGTRVLVIGIGTTGAAVARALVAAKARVAAIDSNDSDILRERAAELTALGVRTELGVDGGIDFPADLVVPSPGIPEHHPLLAGLAPEQLISEPELAWRLGGGGTRLVAVTGTNGKTTTTEMIAACLDAPAAGNIGTPLISVLGAQPPPPIVVAELSSFQLRFASTLRPAVAVLLNVAPDHLDWHGTLDAYGAAKAHVWASQRDTDVAVTNADDEGARATAAAQPPPAQHVEFTLAPPGEGQVGVDDGWIVSRMQDRATAVVEVARLQVPPPHGTANAVAATAAALAAGASPQRIAQALADYRPGRHRLEIVATIGGVTYVDDSKATNPHAAAAALDAWAPESGGQPRVLWIAGGLAKGLTFEGLAPHIRRSVRAAYLIGTAAPELADLVTTCGRPAVQAETVAAAVADARSAARPGEVVLLAPACASMDQFRNYAERGEAFREAVEAGTTNQGPEGPHGSG